MVKPRKIMTTCAILTIGICAVLEVAGVRESISFSRGDELARAIYNIERKQGSFPSSLVGIKEASSRPMIGKQCWIYTLLPYGYGFVLSIPISETSGYRYKSTLPYLGWQYYDL